MTKQVMCTKLGILERCLIDKFQLAKKYEGLI